MMDTGKAHATNQQQGGTAKGTGNTPQATKTEDALKWIIVNTTILAVGYMGLFRGNNPALLAYLGITWYCVTKGTLITAVCALCRVLPKVRLNVPIGIRAIYDMAACYALATSGYRVTAALLMAQLLVAALALAKGGDAATGNS